MGHHKDTLRDNFESLATDLSSNIANIVEFIDILYVSPEDKKAAKKAIRILNKKLDDMKECTSLHDARKIVKMKKLALYNVNAKDDNNV